MWLQLVNRALCWLGVHDVFHVENRIIGSVEERCRHCPRMVVLYKPRKW